jgi:ABC-type antimicrobial peptide transport system permease subunit
VIGVVGDIRVRGLERTSEPQMYMPSWDVGESPLDFYDPKDHVVRTSGSPAAVLPALREIIRSVKPQQPISDVMTLSDLLASQTDDRRAQVRVLVALAILALILAGLGIHGLLAYTVAQQRHEIAVRLALGADANRIARGVVRTAMTTVLLGLVPGIVIAVAGAGSVRAMLFGVPTVDIPTLVVTVAVCLVVSFTGAWAPVRRAVRVSPVAAMRSE